MISLRDGRTEDADALGRLFTASRELLTFLPKLHTPEEDRVFIREHIMPHYAITVAERNGIIVGYMAEGEGWVEQLYLAPGVLRLGIGSALLDAAKARQPALELWCFAENTRGRAFYERHGFVAIELTDGSGNMERAPDIRYRWAREA